MIKQFLIALLFITLGLNAEASDIHKGNTYPLKTFSDPELQKALKEWEEREPDKWGGYLEFTGKPGTDRSIGQADLFAPFYQDKNDLFFFNVRGQLDDQDSHEYNIGIGHRHLFDKFIFGSYFYHDKSNTEFDKNFTQKTFGIEALWESFDFRINGYLPESNEQVISKSIPVESLTISYTAQKALAGFDGEIGYRLPLDGLLEDTRIYAGGYHYLASGQVEGLSGPRVRLETRVHDLSFLGYGSRLMVGVESQYDEQRGNQTYAKAQIRIPFHSIFEKIRSSKSKPPIVLTKLERRMLEPVVRAMDITTGTTIRETPALNLEGKPYTKLVKMDTSSSLLQIKTKMKELTDNGELPLLIVRKNQAGNTFLYNEPLIVLGGYTWAMAGTNVLVKTRNPFNGELDFSSIKTKGNHPNFNFASLPFGLLSRIFYVQLENKAHINGWNIDATDFNYAVKITTQGNFFITNSLLKNSKTHNVWLQNEGVTLNVFNSQFIGAKSRGLHIEDNATLNIHNSYIANNGSHGIDAKNGGHVFASNLLIEDNKGSGIDSNGTSPKGSLIDIKNSTIRGNGHGVIVNYSNPPAGYNRIIANNLDIYDNARRGVGVFGAKLWLSNSRVLNNGGGITLQQFKYYNDPPTFAYVKNTIFSGNGYGGATTGGIIYFTNSIIEKSKHYQFRNAYGWRNTQQTVGEPPVWKITSKIPGKIYIDGVLVKGFDIYDPKTQ